jgi:5-oxoprolinase (ATP-hydrolysing)
VIYQAAPGAKPVFSGGRVIGNWQPGPGGIWQSKIADVADGSWYFEQLWVNGRRAVRARTPNEKWHRLSQVREELLEPAKKLHDTRARQTVTVDAAEGRARIDFTGTSGQDATNYNAPLSICRAVVLYVFRCLVGAPIPMNEGCLAPLEIVVPEGSFLNPRPPAAVIAGNTEVSQSIAEALFGALGVLAGSQGTMNNFVWGNARYQNYETIGGGTGAGQGFDGASAVHSHMTNTRMTDAEVLESQFPVRVETFAVRRGSGGAGQWQGGDGILRRLRFLEPMTVTTLCSHRDTAAHGLQGGGAGLPGINAVQRVDGRIERLRGNDQTEMAAGDVFVMETPGGGAFGAAS